MTDHKPNLTGNVLSGHGQVRFTMSSGLRSAAGIAAPHATIVLAGLLETQRETVVAAYTACGCTLDAIDRRGDWTVLRLTAGADRYVPTAPFDPKGRDGWALDL